jgi:hypothetical protein
MICQKVKIALLFQELNINHQTIIKKNPALNITHHWHSYVLLIYQQQNVELHCQMGFPPCIGILLYLPS